jgi:hypothetical protein
MWVLKCALTLILCASAAGLGACDVIRNSLCHPTAMSAARQIIGAWCERRPQCDAAAPSVEICVADRIARSYVPDDADCRGCSEEEEEVDCVRSTCDDDKIARCVEQVHAMDCGSLIDPTFGTVRYPPGCEGCFR